MPRLRSSLGLLLLGAMLVLVHVVVYWRAFHISPFSEGVPEFGRHEALSVAMCLIAACCLMGGLFNEAQKQGTFDAGWTLGFWPRQLSMRIAVIVSIVACASVPWLLVASPRAFNRFSLEDHSIEWSSVIFLVAAMLSSFALAWRRHCDRTLSRIPIVVIVGFGILCFLMAGEEISWGQRIFQWNSAAIFEQNLQHETNLHNFFTNQVEYAYYVLGGWVMLFLLPLWKALRIPTGRLLGRLNAIVPRPFLMMLAALIAAYNFEKWVGVPTQLALWGTVFALTIVAWKSAGPSDRWTAQLLLVLVAVTQLIFLIEGPVQIRQWDLSEYKEMFIDLGFFLYSMDLWETTNRANLPAA